MRLNTANCSRIYTKCMSTYVFSSPVHRLPRGRAVAWTWDRSAGWQIWWGMAEVAGGGRRAIPRGGSLVPASGAPAPPYRPTHSARQRLGKSSTAHSCRISAMRKWTLPWMNGWIPTSIHLSKSTENQKTASLHLQYLALRDVSRLLLIWIRRLI